MFEVVYCICVDKTCGRIALVANGNVSSGNDKLSNGLFTSSLFLRNGIVFPLRLPLYCKENDEIKQIFCNLNRF